MYILSHVGDYIADHTFRKFYAGFAERFAKHPLIGCLSLPLSLLIFVMNSVYTSIEYIIPAMFMVPLSAFIVSVILVILPIMLFVSIFFLGKGFSLRVPSVISGVLSVLVAKGIISADPNADAVRQTVLTFAVKTIENSAIFMVPVMLFIGLLFLLFYGAIMNVKIRTAVIILYAVYIVFGNRGERKYFIRTRLGTAAAILRIVPLVCGACLEYGLLCIPFLNVLFFDVRKYADSRLGVQRETKLRKIMRMIFPFIY